MFTCHCLLFNINFHSPSLNSHNHFKPLLQTHIIVSCSCVLWIRIVTNILKGFYSTIQKIPACLWNQLFEAQIVLLTLSLICLHILTHDCSMCVWFAGKDWVSLVRSRHRLWAAQQDFGLNSVNLWLCVPPSDGLVSIEKALECVIGNLGSPIRPFNSVLSIPYRLLYVYPLCQTAGMSLGLLFQLFSCVCLLRRDFTLLLCC